MRTLANALQQQIIGEKLDLPWPLLNRDFDLRTRTLNVVMAAESAGKSVFALNLAMNIDGLVLYCAQDSAPSVLARSAALCLGREINVVKAQLEDEHERQEVLAAIQDDIPNLLFNVGPVTVEEIGELIEAIVEFYGESPRLIIVDNLIDLVVPGHVNTDVAFYASALNPLKQLAVDNNTAVMALHHVTKGDDKLAGTQKLKLKDMLYAGSREAANVLGIYHNDRKTRMYVQILKQRDGEADADGGMRHDLVWHAPYGRLDRW